LSDNEIPGYSAENALEKLIGPSSDFQKPPDCACADKSADVISASSPIVKVLVAIKVPPTNLRQTNAKLNVLVYRKYVNEELKENHIFKTYLEAIKCLSNTNKYGNIKRLLFIF
jgi:hypothetical protein